MPLLALGIPTPFVPSYLTFSPALLPTSPTQLHAFHESLGDLIGSHLSFDPYCAYLEDVPSENMWSTFFDHAFDFSMAFDAFKRP